MESQYHLDIETARIINRCFCSTSFLIRHTLSYGDVKSPCIDKNITINFPYGTKYATFHSHPSGIGNCEKYIGEDGKPYMPIWQQSPTKDDFNVAGNHICYVFGRRNDCVYVYTRQGVQTIISTSAFISNSKYIQP